MYNVHCTVLYTVNMKAVIFVLDTSNHDRLPEAHVELVKLMSEKELKDASLLILANKQVLDNIENKP